MFSLSLLARIQLRVFRYCIIHILYFIRNLSEFSFKFNVIIFLFKEYGFGLLFQQVSTRFVVNV